MRRQLICTLIGYLCIQQAYCGGHALLVEPEWLLNNLNRSNIRIIDARQPAHYSFQHIRHAVNIPVDLTFRENLYQNMVATIGHINALFNNRGIHNQDHLVIYDDGVFLDAARLFWIFEVFGHRKVSILNGGFAQWVENRLPTAQQATVVKPSHYVISVNPAKLATRFSTRLAIDNPYITIIDSRTKAEYDGGISRAERGGHIPTSINIPSLLNFSEEKGFTRLKPDTELMQLYRSRKVEQKIIAYCNRGKESAATYFVLRKLGFDVSTYDGSWLDWGNDALLPVSRQ